MAYPDGHQRFRIVDAPEGGETTILESSDSLLWAESRLAKLIDNGDDCDLYLMDIEENKA